MQVCARPHLMLLAALVCGALALPAPSAADAQAPPPSFFGVDAWMSPPARDFARLGTAKVGLYRMFVRWSSVEPCAGCRDWTELDRVIGDAARAHIRVLPFVWGSPAFLEAEPRIAPLDPGALPDYAAVVRDVVSRYGTHGSFWATHPSIPRSPLAGLQVWNEPSHPNFWGPRPSAAGYARLLKAAAAAVRSVDPATKVVLAGLPTAGGVPLASYLAQLYQVPGFSRSFDVMALHPYVATPQALFDIVGRARALMRSHGDGGKQTWITEMGWASVPGPYFSGGSTQGQARLLSESYRGLIARRATQRIGLLAWFALRDHALAPGEADGWVFHTGLFTSSGAAKPAWAALVKLAGGRAGFGLL